MFDWFKQRRGTAAPGPRLAARLADYPGFPPPHPGPPSRWTDAQARENLDHLLAHRAERVAALVTWLDGEGLDARAALAGADPAPFLAALHQWINSTWPALPRPADITKGIAAWMRSTRDGDQRIHAWLLDIALLLGELILRRHPGFRWDLDLDEGNGRDGMRSYRRPVLLVGPSDGPMPAGLIDLEEVVVARYLDPSPVLHGLSDHWALLLDDAVAGRYDPPPA